MFNVRGESGNTQTSQKEKAHGNPHVPNTRGGGKKLGNARRCDLSEKWFFKQARGTEHASQINMGTGDPKKRDYSIAFEEWGRKSGLERRAPSAEWRRSWHLEAGSGNV